MFAYCTDVLHLSEAEAYLRITAARVAREHPVTLAMLADGRLHLSSVARLAAHLTAANRDHVLARAAHRSKREILELVAELSPQPDAPSLIRKLPGRRDAAAADGASYSGSLAAPGGAPGPTSGRTALAPLAPERRDRLCPDRVAAREACPARRQGAMTAEAAGTAAHSPDSLEPIAPGRYKVQFTASATLREKLERLRALMHSSVPDGDLAALIEAAVDEKLARLEAKRFARTEKPRKAVATSDTRPRSRHVPAAVRRAVWARDGGRCRFVDDQGRRCPARRGLEFHHRHPFGMGGDHEVEQIRLLCRTHNRCAAEVDYGRSGPTASLEAASSGPPHARGSPMFLRRVGDGPATRRPRSGSRCDGRRGGPRHQPGPSRDGLAGANECVPSVRRSVSKDRIPSRPASACAVATGIAISPSLRHGHGHQPEPNPYSSL